MRTNDPRLRQTLNQISHNLESANESAQEGFYRFNQQYLAPCIAAVGSCLADCTAPCLPNNRESQLRRRRRGRAELNFDFYDDWDNESANDGILAWGNDELDRLLAGSGAAGGNSVRGGVGQQPRRQRKMSYGAARTRRKSSILPDRGDDPTVIPKSSLIGFLERLPWKFGPRGVKYRPSAADLQERPGRLPHDDDYPHQEDQPLIEEDEENDEEPEQADGANGALNKGKDRNRARSTTQSSQETSNSLSSRGDLIFDDEDEDAVPLDDEFAVALARRNTGLTSDEHLAGVAGRSRRTTSGQSIRSKERRESRIEVEASRNAEITSMAELSKEEEEAEAEEELEIVRRRSAAQQLAVSQGLARDQVRSYIL